MLCSTRASPAHWGYFKNMVKVYRHYGSFWALQYQQDDRWRHEQIPELLRKESKRYSKRVALS